MELIACAFALLFPIGDPEWELLSFPPASLCQSMLDFNGNYRQHLERNRLLHVGCGWKWYTDALKEAKQLRDIWDNLRYAHRRAELSVRADAATCTHMEVSRL